LATKFVILVFAPASEREARGMSLMGVDVGTTGVKAVIFNADGVILGVGYREYPLIYPGLPGWVELDSEQVWQATKDAIRQALAQAGNRDPVEAIAISSMGETAVPLDTGGKPLMNAIANLDTRAVAQAQRLEQRWGNSASLP
jgi:Sugar (pentulose and hexulose) kinases